MSLDACKWTENFRALFTRVLIAERDTKCKWGGPEVLALIHAKEKEHEVLKLT
jgi:hypothetical protein